MLLKAFLDASAMISIVMDDAGNEESENMALRERVAPNTWI